MLSSLDRDRAPIGTGWVRALRTALLLTALACGLLAGESAAVLLSGGDGSQNTSAPSDDFGFASAGVINGMTVVYLGNRWVLTAHHVVPSLQGSVDFGGGLYPVVPGSKIRLMNADTSLTELAVFRLLDDPGVPAATITTTSPSLNATVHMLGNGVHRGPATSWSGIDGFLWGSGRTLRWGTNRISDTPQERVFETDVFVTSFTAPGGSGVTSDECQGLGGDSGGPVFRKIGGSWQLIGVLLGVSSYYDQPKYTVLYGNLTYAADITTYRTSILDIVGQPSCSDGLDDDGDGTTDYPNDPGCSDASDTSERDAGLRCDDGVDNDGDGLVDHPADPECLSPTGAAEAPPVPALVTPAVTTLVAALVLIGARAGLRG